MLLRRLVRKSRVCGALGEERGGRDEAAEEAMNTTDTSILLRAAMAAVRECAVTMETQAESLLLALPELSMNEKLRPAVLELSSVLKDTASRVTFELALLQAEIGEGKAVAAAVVQRLSNLDSTLMTVLDGSTDVASQLEKAAEQDEDNEPAFALVMQATEVMLRKVGNARAATQVLAPRCRGHRPRGGSRRRRSVWRRMAAW